MVNAYCPNCRIALVDGECPDCHYRQAGARRRRAQAPTPELDPATVPNRYETELSEIEAANPHWRRRPDEDAADYARRMRDEVRKMRARHYEERKSEAEETKP